VVRFQVSSGVPTPRLIEARRFPFTLGREPEADCQLSAPGIWERHLRLDLDPSRGFLLRVRSPATAWVNGQAAADVRLRNGDVVEFGPVRMVFTLGETRQKSLAFREALTWGSVALLCILQVVMVHWIMP